MTLKNAFEDVSTDRATKEITQLLARMLRMLESNTIVDSSQRQRVVVDAFSAALATVSTVTSVTNMVTLAGLDQRMYADLARTAFATGIRAKIN